MIVQIELDLQFKTKALGLYPIVSRFFWKCGRCERVIVQVDLPSLAAWFFHK